MIKFITPTLLLLVINLTNTQAQYNYAEAFQKSLFFYEVQTSGKKPVDNRVTWRGDAHLNDGKDMGWDMSGGWYDAGDNVKWNVSMSYAALTLGLSMTEYKQGYISTGQLKYGLNQMQIVGDYFDKCLHYTSANDLSTYKIVIDLAAGGPDHGHWASSEVAHLLVTDRQTYYADKDYPNNSSVGGMSASLAIAAYILRESGNTAKADKYLLTAERLYKFAKTYRITDATKDKCNNAAGAVVTNVGYGAGRDQDDLSLAASLLHKAKLQANANYGGSYLSEAISWGSQIMWVDPYDAPHQHYGMSYNHLYAYYMLAKLVPEDKQYEARIARDCNCFASISCPGQPMYGVSPGGLSKINFEWGTLRHVNNAAFIGFLYADFTTNATDKVSISKWAKSQLDYSLGSNPSNLSYMAGFQPNGKKVVTSAHHRTAYGPWAGFEHLISGKPEYNLLTTRHTLYGALLGGPDWNDVFVANVGDAEKNEVALDYEAGFTGNLARMAQIAPGGSVLTNFPTAETKQPEYFAEAAVIATDANSIIIKAGLNNRSAWPATVKNDMSFRYYFTTASGTNSASIVSGDGALISTPVSMGLNNYYVIISFPNINIFPGGLDGNNGWRPFYRKEVVFKLSNTSGWNNSDDFSYTGIAAIEKSWERVSNMPVYNDGIFLEGKTNDLVTSTYNAFHSDDLNIYPNPATEEVIINALNSTVENMTVSIVNSLGIFVYRDLKFNQQGGNILKIDTDLLSNGIYLLQVKTDQTVIEKKLIISK